MEVDRCCIFIISYRFSPWFKAFHSFHKPVTLPGDTAGSRGVCSLLLLWASTHTHTAVTQTNDGVMMYHCWALRWTTVTDSEILFLPLSFALAAMFPRQSGLRGKTPLLSLLIHSRLETWTQTQLHIVPADIQRLFILFFYKSCLLLLTGKYQDQVQRADIIPTVPCAG